MLVNPVSMLTSRWYLHMWKLSMCFPDHCLESAEEHKHVSILLSTCFQNVQRQKQIRNSLKAFTWHQVHDNMAYGDLLDQEQELHDWYSSSKNMASHKGQSTVHNFTAQIIYVFDRKHSVSAFKPWMLPWFTFIIQEESQGLLWNVYYCIFRWAKIMNLLQ